MAEVISGRAGADGFAVSLPPSGENKLSTQLCGRLNSLCRHTPGWDFLQFRREEPGESDGRRAIDLVASPAGNIIWINGRSYDEISICFRLSASVCLLPMAKTVIHANM